MNNRQSQDLPGLDLRDPRVTEAFNPRTARIDRVETLEIVRLLAAEDRTVPAVVAGQAEAIAAVIDEVSDRLCGGGRLLYVGAGTSGRLGVLDAAECPPTFGADPELVQGIIAGGPEALTRSREGVEDDEGAGRATMRERNVGPRDFVLGIATSATTPFVRAALEEATARGAGTGLLSCTPPPREEPATVQHLITPLVGPEAIVGSTRLKAGTATKLVLNTLTTGVMIRLGKVYGNLMVDLRATSRKLVDRSLRMLEAVARVERPEARRLLIAAGGSVKTAMAMHAMGVGRFAAERRLDACDGFLAEALERFGPDAPLHFISVYPPGRRHGWERLLERLTSAPARVQASVGQSRRAAGHVPMAGHPAGAAKDPRLSPPAGRTRAEVAWHLDHLIRFEREAIRPRLSTWPADTELEFVDWTDDTVPGGSRAEADIESLLREFRAQREETTAVVRAAGPSLLDRTGRLGAERFTACQFVRAIVHHDEAHALRIGERLHPALFEGEKR